MFILIHSDYDDAFVPLQISLQISWHQVFPKTRDASLPTYYVFQRSLSTFPYECKHIGKLDYSLITIVPYLIVLQSNTAELEINLLTLYSILPPSLRLCWNFLMGVDFPPQMASISFLHFQQIGILLSNK